VAEGADPGRPVTEEGYTPQPVEALPDVPGAVSTRPDVLEARQAVVTAREAFTGDVEQLRDSARAAFDIKARIRGFPERAREDPVRAAVTAAVAVAVVGGLATLIRRSRRPKPYGLLPLDIEQAIDALGKDSDRVRRSVEESFASYLREHGANEPSRRRRIPPAVTMVLAPVAAQVARVVIQRMTAAPPTAGPAAGTGGDATAS
jgi:hypothetical protein